MSGSTYVYSRHHLSRMPDKITAQILAFYGRCADDEHHRYRSWEHCFGYFRNRRALDHDTAALHLAFYLASWGMYRGSSALLWKDYKIHKPAIAKLLEEKFKPLWNLRFDDASNDQTTADLIVSLSHDLKTTYQKKITTVNGKPRAKFQPSEILVTKILLGTVGCTPACDRFFIDGFRSTSLGYSRFGPRFLGKVFQFCRTHKVALLKIQDKIYSKSGTRYPMMKLVDMYFWELGSRRAARRR
jgi:hypothetical protein